MLRRIPLLIILFTSLYSRSQVIDQLLSSDSSSVVQKVLKDADFYRLQIIYTEITEKKSVWRKSQTLLTTHLFRNKPDEYFFPASLVKLPVACFALEKLRSLSDLGIGENTPFAPLSDFQCNGKRENFPQTTADLIKQIFVYSDNTAFNYLYELCGQDDIQRRLKEMGYKQARIVEKIAPCDGKGNAKTGPIAFYSNQQIIYKDLVKRGARVPGVLIDSKVGKGYLSNGKYISAPKDFGGANFIPLHDLHHMLISLVLPKEVSEEKRFQLTEIQRSRMLSAMCKLPKGYCPDSCKGQSLVDNQMKYLMGKSDTLPNSWKIYNKVGLAHGFMSDCSYFEDSSTGIKFFLSAVIYVNEDGILNDGKYEYATIGTPFLRRLGELIYEREKSKRVLPR